MTDNPQRFNTLTDLDMRGFNLETSDKALLALKGLLGFS